MIRNTLPREGRGLALTLLAASSLTMMAGAIVAPSLPGIQAAFADLPRVELLARLVLTLPALTVALLAPIAGGLLDRLGRRPVLLASLALYALAGASELASEERRGVVMGALTASLFAGQFMSPILSQPLIDHGSIGHVFAAASGLSLLLAAAPFLVPKAVLRPARGALRG